jgi:hypothetical protein
MRLCCRAGDDNESSTNDSARRDVGESPTKGHWQGGETIVDHSLLIACLIGVSFFFIFFGGAVALGREKPK